MEIKYCIIDESIFTSFEERKAELLKNNPNLTINDFIKDHCKDKNFKRDSIKIKDDIKVFALKTMIQEKHSLIGVNMINNFLFMDDNKNINEYDLSNELLILKPIQLINPVNFHMAAFMGPPTKYW
jgi:hypothetical protein